MNLCRASQRFDVSRGVPFRTYAIWWMRAALSHTLAAFTRKKRVGQMEEVSLSSLDTTDASGERIPVVVIDYRSLKDDPAKTTEERDRVADCLRFLHPLYRHVIERRYLHDETLEEIGKAAGLTKQRVLQLEIEAVAKLRRIFGLDYIGEESAS